jgi:starch synthase
MKILLASSEVHPYSKTGGLADMVGALAKMLARAGHRVGVVTPLYAGIHERYSELKLLGLPLDFPLATRRVHGEVWELKRGEGFSVYFVDQPVFFQRPGLYQNDGVDYSDNAERFIFLSKAVAHLALHLDWQPELLHVHDWQTGFAALFIQHHRKLTGQGTAPRICTTLHNAAYQGVFPAAQYALTNLPWDYLNPASVEFYGQMSCLKAGIAGADVITTVSPRYAREITTEEFGAGLDGLLRYRQNDLFGILNGVDYDEWNALNDPNLKQTYSADTLEGKLANKVALQKELGLPANESAPLFGSISRLVEQKGIDILLGALEEMLSTNLQFVLLGAGDAPFERAFEHLARRFPSQVAVRFGYNEGLAHRIEAGCDFFLMPSRFEPCGLNQMYSLRYGTVPIVRRTGGLDDTVTDVQDDTEKANGIKFGEYSAHALAKAIRKALALFDEKELLKHFQLNGMAKDFSWDRTVGEFLKVYQKALGKQGN